MVSANPSLGIRVTELRLGKIASLDGSYGVSFRAHDGDYAWRPLSVIAGPSQTGKTTVVDFIKYVLGGSAHPQHPEVIASVRSAMIESWLSGSASVIERAATGPESAFASVWMDSLESFSTGSELRASLDPAAPDGLSQILLSACNMENIALPEAPTQVDSATQRLSIRDFHRVMFLPNERLDNKNLVFEHANHMVAQKFRQTIDVLFDVHDAAGTDLAARLRTASEAAAEAQRTVTALTELVQEEHPLGPLVLETERDELAREIATLEATAREYDEGARSRRGDLSGLQERFSKAQNAAQIAAVRVRNRESLLARLASLRGQYADDKRKLTFLREAERLFDPLQVSVCPACLSTLESAPSVRNGQCNLCSSHLPESMHHLSMGEITSRALEPSLPVDEEVPAAANSTAELSPAAVILEAEYRAVSRRLSELNDYWTRLDADLLRLKAAAETANADVEAAAEDIDRMSDLPSPFLAARDALTRARAEAQMRLQQTETGLRLWERVRQAADRVTRLQEQVARLRAERRDAAARPNRNAMISELSERFSHILQEFEYPKLSGARIGEDLLPSVRGLPYTAASSGGAVLISLAWYLSVWELAHEKGQRGSGLLVIDSPQKNLGHGAHPDDPEFADSRLVENFYEHVRTWLDGEGRGAQLIVVDNSPPESVSEHIVARFTRSRSVTPYGLIDDAVD